MDIRQPTSLRRRLRAALRWEIGRQGSDGDTSVCVFSLLQRAPYLRPLLGDAGLLETLRAHDPHEFHVKRSVISTSMLRDGVEHANVAWRVTLAVPLRGDEDPPPRSQETRATAARLLLRCAEWRLFEGRAGGRADSATRSRSTEAMGDSATLGALVGRHKHVQRALRAYVAAGARPPPLLLPSTVTAAAASAAAATETEREGERPWWRSAFREMHELLAATPERFIVGGCVGGVCSTDIACLMSLDDLRATRLTLADPLGAAERAATADIKIRARLNVLLRKAPTSEGLALQLLGQDPSIRANLGGRSLLVVLRRLLLRCFSGAAAAEEEKKKKKQETKKQEEEEEARAADWVLVETPRWTLRWSASACATQAAFSRNTPALQGKSQHNIGDGDADDVDPAAAAAAALTLVDVTVLDTNEVRGIGALRKVAGISTEALLFAAVRHATLAPLLAPEFAHLRVLPSVSRLDKGTSGVLIVPLSRASESRLTHLFATRAVKKTYLCLVAGVTPPSGVISQRLHVSRSKTHFRVYPSPKGKEAVTLYTRLRVLRMRRQVAVVVVEENKRTAAPGAAAADRSPKDAGASRAAAAGAAASASGGETCCDPTVFSLLEVSPKTGRTHQIRAHFASAGHALVCDTKYKVKRAKRQMAWCPRLFLHAMRAVVPVWTDDDESESGGDGSGSVKEKCSGAGDTACAFDVSDPLPRDLAAVLEDVLEEIEPTAMSS